VSEDDKQRIKKEKLLKLVDDPDKYIEEKALELLQKREVPKQTKEAQEWLNRQGCRREDENDLVRIIRDYEIEGSPMARAKSAWSILELERMKAHSQTKESTAKSTPEGVGRSVPASSDKTKSELLNDLRAAEKKHGTGSKEMSDVLLQLARLKNL